jgi:hypothetical protein
MQAGSIGLAKHCNHQLSAMACPAGLADVDLFGPGAAEHWYEAYDILHAEAPVLRLPGEGLTPERDAFILTKYADIERVVKDWARFPPTLSLLLEQIRLTGQLPQQMPDIDAMVQSIYTLRPTPELWRAHRQELTDPWVGPGATRHKAGSWSKERRAVARIEATRLGLDIRFVVTNLEHGTPEWIYDTFYTNGVTC